MLLASRVSGWKQALVILKPDTLLRWHRQDFRLFWKLKFKPKSIAPKISPEIVALIKQMGAENQACGAEKIGVNYSNWALKSPKERSKNI
jgi:putative transposase